MPKGAQVLSSLSLIVALALTGPALAADSRLADAVRDRDDRVVSALLAQRGIDVNAPEADGATALHWAAHFNDLALTERLIKAGANVNAANRFGVTPLILAASHGRGARVVEKLLAAGANPDALTREEENALLLASRAGDTDSVRLLLAKGAPVWAPEGWRGQTALMWAAAENHPETVKALLAAGADMRAKTVNGFTALLFAVRAGHQDVVKLLLDRGADIDDAMGNGTSALTIATLNAHWDLGVYLLERGANPNADGQGWAPLHQAVITRSPHHADVNPQRIPSGKLDSLDFIKALIAHGADVNKRARNGNIDGFRQWIRREGATPFFLAAKAADVPLMRLLAEAGADPLLGTNLGVTPLAAAAGVGYAQGEAPGSHADALEAVKYAMSLGGKVDAVDDLGFTPMHGAAARGANDIAQFLFDNGARLDIATKVEGWTPLDVAEGVFIGGTYKRNLPTADKLRELAATARRTQVATAP